MTDNPVRNDTRRIRRALQRAVVNAVGGEMEVVLPGRVSTVGSATRVVVTFTSVRQQTLTLSGGGITAEEGTCAINVVVGDGFKGDPVNQAYTVAGSVTAAFTPGQVIAVTEEADAAKGDPVGQTTAITIMGQATMASSYRESDDFHIPILVPYRAATEAGP